MRRQVVLDTETTGLEPERGHRLIEIGAVELVKRRLTGRRYHQYLQPDRDIDEGAGAVHGISQAFLADKPRFEDIVDELLLFLEGAELIIHNAPFDIGFLNSELSRLEPPRGTMVERCTVVDTLVLARNLHPGQKNTLDALCKRYGVDNTQRELHGALLDAEILAEVYLAMTGGQASLPLGGQAAETGQLGASAVRPVRAQRPPLPVLWPTDVELDAHRARLEVIDQVCGGICLWKALDAAPPGGMESGGQPTEPVAS
jgi:DNA polymerase-3 subunit epsilon